MIWNVYSGSEHFKTSNKALRKQKSPGKILMLLPLLLLLIKIIIIIISSKNHSTSQGKINEKETAISEAGQRIYLF